MIGRTEETLTANEVPYEVGIARYSELAKSMMLGDETGMLKLLFDDVVFNYPTLAEAYKVAAFDGLNKL